MKRKSTVYGLLGAIGLVVGLSAINPAVSDKSKKNDKIAVSVVSYDKAKKSDNLNAATGGAFTATSQAIGSYASENVTSSEGKKVTKSRNRKAVVTPKPTATPKPREQIVKIAKSYKGKITYLWGGKPSDAQISGKNQPKELDCSGFIQFVYSKYKKKRISELGSTIAIAGLPKIKKSELKVGDIGLRNGTGSIYFDADGKSYSEPQFAEEANDKKIEKFDKKIDINKKKKYSAKKKIKNKTKKIEEIKDKIEKDRVKMNTSYSNITIDPIMSQNVEIKELEYLNKKYKYLILNLKLDEVQETQLIIFSVKENIFMNVLRGKNSVPKIIKEYFNHDDWGCIKERIFDIDEDFLYWIFKSYIDTREIPIVEDKEIYVTGLKSYKGVVRDLGTSLKGHGERICDILSTLAFLLNDDELKMVAPKLTYVTYAANEKNSIHFSI